MTIAAILAFGRSWWRTAAAIVAVALLCLQLGQCQGKRAERAEWQAAAATAKAEMERVARAADALAVQRRAAAEQSITDQRQEIDDALATIPDQAPTARQRARACIELRRQAARAGTAGPAC